MIHDLHSHTYYSFCGKDNPKDVIEAAISGGIKMLGICDHSYGVAIQRDYSPHRERSSWLIDYQRAVDAYLDTLLLLKEKYRGQIDIKCGIEIPTQNIPHILLPDEIDVSRFEYCLIEHIDYDDTTVSDPFAFAERCGCKKVGIAHTDLFSYLENRNINKEDFFKKMAQKGMFWELNVNYDSIHKFREHAYVERFFADKEQQETVLKSGVDLSVGFDGHRVNEYLPERVKSYCKRLEELKIPTVYAK